MGIGLSDMQQVFTHRSGFRELALHARILQHAASRPGRQGLAALRAQRRLGKAGQAKDGWVEWVSLKGLSAVSIRGAARALGKSSLILKIIGPHGRSILL